MVKPEWTRPHREPGVCPGALQPLPGMWSGVLRAGELSGRAACPQPGSPDAAPPGQAQMKEPHIPAADPPECSRCTCFKGHWDLLPPGGPLRAGGAERQGAPCPS